MIIGNTRMHQKEIPTHYLFSLLEFVRFGAMLLCVSAQTTSIGVKAPPCDHEMNRVHAR